MQRFSIIVCCCKRIFLERLGKIRHFSTLGWLKFGSNLDQDLDEGYGSMIFTVARQDKTEYVAATWQTQRQRLRFKVCVAFLLPLYKAHEVK